MNLENVKLNINTSLVLNVGFPMGKTNAPRVYNKLFSLLDMNAIMLPVEIQKGCLKEFMAALKTLNIRYFCTTMPHKADIIDYLDEVDEDSRCFKSVNAVRIDENGKSHGIGMDGKGAVGALLRSGVELSGREALMLGSGGVSGVIGLELAKRGVKKLTILNRTEDKAREIACVLNKKTKMEVQYGLAEPARLDAAAKTADLFLQLTPLGMAGYGQTHSYLGFIEALPKTCVVFDVIINPPDTQVIARAKERGLKTVPGMHMLVEEMTEIFAFMFGAELRPEDKEACLAELCGFLNVPVPALGR